MISALRKPTSLLALLCLALAAFFAFHRSAQPGLAEGQQRHYLPMMQRGSPAAWIGLHGGSITCLVYDPLNPQIVYAGTWGAGVFKSSDGGLTWQPSSQGLGNLYIQSLAVDPLHPTTLYTGIYKEKLYKSVDGGLTWFLSSNGIQAEAIVYAIAVDPLNSQILYIATRGISNNGAAPWNGILYKSYDGGASWWPKLENIGNNPDDPFQDWIYSLAISPTSPNLIYAATHEHGAYRSTNYGEYWQEINGDPEGEDTMILDESGRAVVVQPDPTRAIAYIGVWHGAGVYKTIDGGAEWQHLNLGLYYVSIYGMAHDNLQPGTLYLATGRHGVVKSTDGGTTWAVKGLAETLVYTVAIHPQQSNRLLAGTNGGGLYRSDDGGETWAHSQDGLENAYVNALLIDPLTPGLLYAAQYGAGFAYSEDHGETWLQMNNSLSDLFLEDLIAHPTQPYTFFALSRSAGLFRCNLASGPCWEPVTAGLPTQAELTSLLPADFASPENARFMPDQPDAPATLLSMAFSPADPSVAYLGTSGMGIYRSTNGGLTWQETSMKTQTVSTLAAHPTDPLTFFAATNDDDGSADVWATSNGGNTWQRLGMPGGYAFSLVVSADPLLIYAGTHNGVYRFDGLSWAALGPAGETVTALVMHPDDPQRLYAGASSGAYISYDAGQTWQPGPAALAGISVQAITIDPADPAVVYFSTSTHGILRVHIK